MTGFESAAQSYFWNAGGAEAGGSAQAIGSLLATLGGYQNFLSGKVTSPSEQKMYQEYGPMFHQLSLFAQKNQDVLSKPDTLNKLAAAMQKARSADPESVKGTYTIVEELQAIREILGHNAVTDQGATK